MKISVVEIFLSSSDLMRSITIYDGMAVSELKDLLRSCFDGHEIIGLQNRGGVVYPLSLVLMCTDNFVDERFAAVVKNQVTLLLEDSQPCDTLDVYAGKDFRNGMSLYENESLIKLSEATNSEVDLYYEYDGGPLTIAEAKFVLGLGQYSSEFIIDFLIEQVEADEDTCDEDSGWLISESQFDSAMFQLLNRQHIDFSVEQRAISDYVVRSIFSLFNENNSGYCDLREIGCGLMLFSGGEIIDRAQMAYKLVAESDAQDSEGVNDEMMTTAIASVLKVVAALNSSYLNSCDPVNTAEEITKRAFIRAKLLLSDGCSITQDDFEYWFSVVLTIYNEIEEVNDEDEQDVESKSMESSRLETEDSESSQSVFPRLSIDTESAKYDPDTDYSNGDVRESISPNAVVLELRRAKQLLGLTGVAAEDLMELLGDISSRGFLAEEAWLEFLYEFVVGDEEEQMQGIKLGLQIFRAFDLFEKNLVPYTNFCAGLALLTDSPPEDKIMVAFVLNDTQSSGSISVLEFQNLVLSCLRVIVTCSPLAEEKVLKGGLSIEDLAGFTVMEGLAVMKLSYDDSLTLETISEISYKCVALSAA
jgi:hypothetical protein